MALGEKDIRPVAPKHHDVALLRAVEPTKAQQLLAASIRRVIVGRQVGVKQLNADAVATFGARPARETPQVADNAFIRVEAEHPVELQLLPGTLQEKLAVAFRPFDVP